jgi:hypothetical protein
MAKNTLSVLIPDIQNQELEIDIVGRTPLLVKRFDEKTQQGIEDKQAGIASRKKEPRNPKEECERARIKNDKGQDCVKAIWFKKGMAAMAGYFGIPRGNVEQGIYVLGDLLPIKSQKPVMNTARVRVGQGTMAKTSLAYRPEFHSWSCKLRVGFDAAVITPHQVVSLLAHAGSKNGIGEWRPQKGGDYGRFDVFPAGASKAIIAKAKAEGAKAHKEAMAAEAVKEKGRAARKAAAGIVVEDASSTKRKPGRPKKGESDVLAEGTGVPVKRKPGRPKKSEGAPMVANKVLRRPGRPKKTDSDKSAAAAEIERLKQLHGF